MGPSRRSERCGQLRQESPGGSESLPAGGAALTARSAGDGWRARLFALRGELPPLIRRAVGLGAILLVLLAWWGLTAGATPESRLISPALLPSPREVLGSFPRLLTERALVPSIIATLRRVLYGFLLAIATGVPLGILAATSGMLRAALGPIALFLRNIPIAVLIPLTVFWFGIDEAQKVLFIFLATVPFIFGDALAAVVGVQEQYVDTAQTLGARPRQVVVKVLIPLALPDIYGSLRNLFGLAFGYIMLAELINAKYGLGYLINTSQRRGQSEDIFMILIVIGLLAYGIDRLLAFFQRGLFPYRVQKE